MSAKPSLSEALAKARAKIPAAVQRHSLVDMKGFAAHHFVSYTKKAGGQFFQFYSLIRDDTYSPTKYTETEVIFSREVFIKKIYQSKIFPITFQERVHHIFDSGSGLGEDVPAYFGSKDQYAPPVFEDAGKVVFGIIEAFVRSAYVTIGGETVQDTVKKKGKDPKDKDPKDPNQDPNNPDPNNPDPNDPSSWFEDSSDYSEYDGYLRDRIKTCMGFNWSLFRPAYQAFFQREERVYQELGIILSVMKIGIITSDMVPDEENRVNLALDSVFSWWSSHRKFDIMGLEFSSNRDLTAFPKMGANLLDPYGGRVNKSHKHLTTTSSRAGVRFFLTTSAGVTVGLQPYKLDFTYRPSSTGSSGVLFSTDKGVKNLSISVAGNTFKVIYGDQPVNTEVNGYSSENDYRVEIQNDGETFKVVIVNLETQDSTLLYEETDPKLIQPLLFATVTEGYLGNNKDANAGYPATYKGLNYVVSDLDALGKEITSLATDLKVENNEVIVKGSTFSPVGFKEIPTREDHIVFNGALTLVNTYREDFSIEFDNNYQLITEFSTNLSRTERMTLLYQPDTWGDVPLIRSGFAGSKGYEIALVRDTSYNDGYYIHYQIGSLTNSVPVKLRFDIKYKLEMVKHKNVLFVFLDDVLLSTENLQKGYEIPGIAPTFVGTKNLALDTGFEGKLYKLKMLNYYTGDERLRPTTFNDKYINLTFEGNLLDDGNPNRVWEVSKDMVIKDDALVVNRDLSYSYVNDPLYLRGRHDILAIGEEDFTLDFISDIVSTDSLFTNPPLGTRSGSLYAQLDSPVNGGSVISSWSNAKLNKRLVPDQTQISVTRKDGIAYFYRDGVLLGTEVKAFSGYYIDLNRVSAKLGGDLYSPFRTIHRTPEYGFKLRGFRLVKGEALFHTTPRYALDKMQYRPDGRPHIMDSDLLLWLCPSNQEIKYSPKVELKTLPSNKKVILKDTEVLTYESESRVEVLQETYLNTPLFQLKEDLIISKNGDYTIELLFKYEGASPVEHSLPLEGGEHYAMTFVKEQGNMFYYLEGVRYKHVIDFSEDVLLPSSIKFYHIRIVDGALYKTDYTVSHELFSNTPVTQVFHEPWISLQDTSTGREIYWVKDYTSYEDGRVSLTNDSLSREPQSIIKLPLSYNRLYNLLSKWVQEDVGDTYTIEADTPANSPLFLYGDNRGRGLGRWYQYSQNTQITFTERNSGGYETGYLRLNGVWQHIEAPFYGMKAFSYLHAGQADTFGQTTSVSTITLTNNSWTEKELYLKHTNSFNKIPYNTYFNVIKLHPDAIAAHSYDGVVNKRSCHIPKEICLELPEVEVIKDSLTLEGWFKFEELAKDAPIISLKGISRTLILKESSSRLVLEADGNTHITDLELPVQCYFHLRIEVLEGDIYVYVNGNLLNIVNANFSVEDTYTLTFNSPNLDNNSTFLMDDFKINLKVENETSFNPYLSLFELNSYPQDVIDKGKDLWDAFQTSPSVSKTDDELRMEAGSTVTSTLSLLSYAGYKLNPTCLMFSSEGEIKASLSFLDKDGVSLKTSERYITAKEVMTFIPNIIPSEDALFIEVTLEAVGPSTIRDFRYLIEYPMYEGVAVQEGTTFIPVEDPRPHLHYNNKE